MLYPECSQTAGSKAEEAMADRDHRGLHFKGRRNIRDMITDRRKPK
jgi:hypothetical protein